MAKSTSRNQGAAEASDETPEVDVMQEEALTKPSDEETDVVVAEEPDAPEAELTAEDSTDPSDEMEAAVEEVLEPVAEAEPAPRRGGFLPLFLGGVIAAGLGAGAAIYALPYLPPGLMPKPEVDVSALQARVNAQADQITGLSDTLSNFKVPAPDLSAVEGALSDLSAAQAANAAGIADLASRLAQIAAVPEGAQVVVDPAVTAEIGDIRAQLKALVEENARAQKEAASTAAALQAEAQAKAKHTMMQAEAARLGAALEAGEPLAPFIETLTAGGVDVPAELSGEIASSVALQETFGPAARAALKSARLADGDASIGNKIGSFLLAQTGVRSLEAKEGDGADAVLSRAQAAVNAKDFAGALAEISALPGAAQEAFSDWSVQAQARVAAVRAAATLADALK